LKKIAFLTSGGDAPGMNTTLYALTLTCIRNNVIPYGITDGFKGFIEGRGQILELNVVEEMNNRGGTILGSARSKEFISKQGRYKALNFAQNEKIDALVVIGGDGTFRGAMEFYKETKIPFIAIPATIDNDIIGTDYAIGFDSALNTICSCVDKIRDTAESHHRVFLIEVMGRNSGNLAVSAAEANGAFACLVPEEKTDLEELVKEIKVSGHVKSKIILVAEGDEAGSSYAILKALEPKLIDFELRHTVLGHLQRGGAPSFKDRWIASQMGALAIDFLLKGETNVMLSYRSEIISNISMTQKLISAPKNKFLF
jgi:6-phosphofructokinase 1